MKCTCALQVVRVTLTAKAMSSRRDKTTVGWCLSAHKKYEKYTGMLPAQPETIPETDQTLRVTYTH